MTGPVTSPSVLQNPIFGGGFLLMLSGAALALFRQVPTHLWSWLKRRFTVSVTLLDRDPLFEWAKLWLDSLPYSQRAHDVTCQLRREQDEEFSAQSRTIFAPAYGVHFFRHKRKLIWMERTNPNQTESTGASKKVAETIRLTVLGTKQSAIRDIIHEISDFASEDEKQRARAYISGHGWWQRMPQFQPRKLDTVDLPEEDEKLILSSIERFLESRPLYSKRGIPYHLNFLFAGLPGTGKTSIAAALCGHFGLNLHILNIAGPGMNDSSLVQLMLNIPRRSMILMEDVDAVVPESRTRPHKATPVAGESVEGEASTQDGVTLSGLLNCMDGLTAPDGAIIVMTTNHPEMLDPALLRPGRVDVRVNFGPATEAQIQRMCARLVPGRYLNGTVESMLTKGYTTAQVQNELLGMSPAEIGDLSTPHTAIVDSYITQ